MAHDPSFILQSCTKAVAGSEDAAHLLQQKARLEQAVSSSDPALTLDTSRSLLETVFKTILTDRTSDPRLNQDLNPMYTAVRGVLPLNHDSEANEILKRLTNGIVHNVGELRNKYGAASHGDDGYYESPIQMHEAEMVAHFVDGMAGFLLRKHKDSTDPEVDQRIYHNDYVEFNDWLDTQNDPIPVITEGSEPIPYSKFLFEQDCDGYRAVLLQYLESEQGRDTSADLKVIKQIEDEPLICVIQEQREAVDPTPDVSKMLLTGSDNSPAFTAEQADNLATFMRNYTIHDAGVDWQNKESGIAKFRVKLKHELTRQDYPQEHIQAAINDLIEKAREYYPT